MATENALPPAETPSPPVASPPPANAPPPVSPSPSLLDTAGVLQSSSAVGGVLFAPGGDQGAPLVALAVLGAAAAALLLLCCCALLRYTRLSSYYPLEPSALLRLCPDYRVHLWPATAAVLVVAAVGLAVAYTMSPESELGSLALLIAIVCASVAALIVFLRNLLGPLLELLDSLWFCDSSRCWTVTITYEYTYNTNLTQLARTLCSCCSSCRFFPTVQVYGNRGETRKRSLYSMGTWWGGRVVGEDTISLDGPERPGIRTTTRVYHEHPHLSVSTDILEYTFRMPVPKNGFGNSTDVAWIDLTVPERTAMVLMVHKIDVRHAGTSWPMPAYYKLGVNQSSVRIFDGTAKLPQHCDERVRDARAQELATCRESWKWQEFTPASGFTNPAWPVAERSMLPSACWFGRTVTNGVPLLGFDADQQDYIPVNEYFGVQKTLDFYLAALESVVAQFAEAIYGGVTDPRMLETWRSTREVPTTWELTTLAPPKLWTDRVPSEAWQNDSEFAAQLLQGIWPDAIVVPDSIPPRLRRYLTPSVCDAVRLANGKTAPEMMRRKELLVVDLEFLLQYQHIAQAPSVASITVLGRVEGPQVLAPLGILLLWTDESGAQAERWYTPQDSNEDWLLAKTYARYGMVNFHEAVVHAHNCHLITEPYAVAMRRHLSTQHPLYKLLFPHVRYTVLINFLARQALISPGGVFDVVSSLGGKDQAFIKLMADEYAKWTPLSQSVRRKLRRQGLMPDQGALPEGSYPYRDFALPIWDSIEALVRGTVTGYYRTDNDVREDYELQAFLEDLETTGFPGGRFRAADFGNTEALVELLSSVIWTASGRHAAVNFLQYEQLAYGPNFPLWVNKFPPEKGYVRTVDDALVYMCTRKASVGQAAVVWILSQYGSPYLMLLQPTNDDERFQELFVNGPGLAQAQAFSQRLGRVEADGLTMVPSTRKGTSLEYRVLLPSQVPESIAI